MTCKAASPSLVEVLRDPRRVAAAVLGAACLVGGVFVSGAASLGPILISAGGLLLVVGFAWSAITVFELNAPMLKAVFEANNRQAKLTSFAEAQRRSLERFAAELCEDPETAVGAVEEALATAGASWRGPVEDPLLRVFVLCVIVRVARYEDSKRPTRPHVNQTQAAWDLLALAHRAVLALVDRQGLTPTVAAEMLDCTVEQIREDLEHARRHMQTTASPQ